MMTKLKLTVMNQDAGREVAGRKVRLSVTRLVLLLAEDGTRLSGTTPAKKRVIRICQAISSETGRNKIYWTQDSGHQAQPDDERLGQLLLSGAGQQSLSGCGSTRPWTAAQWLRAKHKPSKASVGISR